MWRLSITGYGSKRHTEGHSHCRQQGEPPPRSADVSDVFVCTFHWVVVLFSGCYSFGFSLFTTCRNNSHPITAANIKMPKVIFRLMIE